MGACRRVYLREIDGEHGHVVDAVVLVVIDRGSGLRFRV